MKINYYVVDAFTSEVFKGNPAGVCVLDENISDKQMQSIASENNLSETAFVCKIDNGLYNLRWFTPGFEIDLCGHATLATAYVVCNFVEPGCERVDFKTVSGMLTVIKKNDLYEMRFPKREPIRIECTREITDVMGIKPLEVYSERDLYLVLSSEQEVREYVPDYARMQTLDDWLGIVITAKSESVDFVSRYFCPELMLEDPVTGSTHSSLIPLWSEKSGNQQMIAKQLSKRGGMLYCENGEDSVRISGKAVLYMKGEVNL